MPQLIQLYIRNVLFGFVLSAVFVGLLFWLNIGNLWGLVSGSPVGWIAALMLFVFNGIIFAGAQFAFTILRMEEKEPPRGGPRAPERAAYAPVPAPVPVPVRSQTR